MFQGIGDLTFRDVVPIIDRIHANPVFQEDTQGLETLLTDLKIGMKKYVGIAYADREEDLELSWRQREHSMGRSGAGQGLEVFLGVLEWVMKEAKLLSRAFPTFLVQ